MYYSSLCCVSRGERPIFDGLIMRDLLEEAWHWFRSEIRMHDGRFLSLGLQVDDCGQQIV
jgi:hypothetical protein